MTTTIYRHAYGNALPMPARPAPTPIVERIPKTFDGCTWLAYSDDDGERIGATGRTKKDALEEFPEMWAMFSERTTS